jgi:hypothetical protein
MPSSFSALESFTNRVSSRVNTGHQAALAVFSFMKAGEKGLREERIPTVSESVAFMQALTDIRKTKFPYAGREAIPPNLYDIFKPRPRDVIGHYSPDIRLITHTGIVVGMEPVEKLAEFNAVRRRVEFTSINMFLDRRDVSLPYLFRYEEVDAKLDSKEGLEIDRPAWQIFINAFKLNAGNMKKFIENYTVFNGKFVFHKGFNELAVCMGEEKTHMNIAMEISEEIKENDPNVLAAFIEYKIEENEIRFEIDFTDRSASFKEPSEEDKVIVAEHIRDILAIIGIYPVIERELNGNPVIKCKFPM